MAQNRTSGVGRDATGNVITTGDGNRVRADVEIKGIKTTLPPPGSVDLRTELAEIRAVLKRLGDENSAKIDRALDDASEEAVKPAPNRDEVGEALTRAITYAKKSNSFADEVGKLTPHLTRAVAWLGANWHHLLSAVGLSV